jgi:hypothetical protein
LFFVALYPHLVKYNTFFVKDNHLKAFALCNNKT